MPVRRIRSPVPGDCFGHTLTIGSGRRDRPCARSTTGRLGRSRAFVVLETLSPAERLAFVLHDMFAMPFDEIAPIVGRSSSATSSRAARAAGCKEQPAYPTPIPPLSERSWTPSSQRAGR
jgi:Sigma-70, region 4